MKCYHHNDADGRCAAAIVAMSQGAWGLDRPFDLESFQFIEMDYRTPVNIDEVKDQEPIFIVDFSFKPEVMKALMEKTRNVIWIDHHKSCADYPYAKEQIAGLRDFSDKGRSGCELAWEYLMKTEIPYGVVLIGDYDSWRLEMSPKSLEFRTGIELENQSPLSAFWPGLFQHRLIVEEVINNGRTCIKYRDQFCADYMKQFGFETELEGVEAYACNFYRYGSPGFGTNFQQYPMCIAFAYDGRRFTVSLYSEREDVDCAAIAKKYGGGGHRGASGFICTELPFHPKN